MKKAPTNRPPIWAMHGVVGKLNANSCAHHGLFAREKFVEHLRSRKKPYVGLPDALAGAGEALTIDDATLAAGDAALAAREHGHLVTIFINPANVIGCQPHFFILLSLILDRTKLKHAVLDKRRHNLDTPADKRRFRERIKQRLLTLGTEQARQQLVQKVAKVLEVDDLSVPRELRTLSLADLRQLRAQGVDIANHGWSHASISALTAEEVKDEITQGKRWIERELGLKADCYAVPFGRQLPPFRPQPEVYSFWLLNFDLLHPGLVGPHIFNRETLRL